jgi:hypothetical protein
MTQNYNTLNNDFIILQKLYLSEANKEKLLSKLGTLLFEYNEFIRPFIFNKSTHNITEIELYKLKENKNKLKFFIKDFEDSYYKKWITNNKYEIKLKLSSNIVGRSETYYRKYNFTLISHDDPFTTDEITYILDFVEDCYPQKYKNFKDIPLGLIQNALMCLLTN